MGRRRFYNEFIHNLREAIADMHVRAYAKLGITNVERDYVIRLYIL